MLNTGCHCYERERVKGVEASAAILITYPVFLPQIACGSVLYGAGSDEEDEPYREGAPAYNEGQHPHHLPYLSVGLGVDQAAAELDGLAGDPLYDYVPVLWIGAVGGQDQPLGRPEHPPHQRVATVDRPQSLSGYRCPEASSFLAILLRAPALCRQHPEIKPAPKRPIASQNVTAPKPGRLVLARAAGLITSQNVTAPKPLEQILPCVEDGRSDRAGALHSRKSWSIITFSSPSSANSLPAFSNSRSLIPRKKARS